MNIRKILFVMILSLFVVIAIRRTISFSSSESLHGLYETAGMPVLSVKSWINGNFQEKFVSHIEDLPGMRGTFIRIRNQYDYSLFSIPHASKIIMGKNGCLFGEENIHSYLGLDFAGKNYLDVKANELKLFQDELWRKKKILLMVIFTPDKATFFPELIPDRLMKKNRKMNNYLYYSKKCVESGINLIDFNRYFLQIKDTSRYPLYAKTGAHWSTYGAMLAADSMIRYLEKKLGLNLPGMVFEKVTTRNIAKDDDDDISRTLNLFWKIRQPALAYPKIRFVRDSKSVRPAALFIGDSYYWNWYKPGIIRNVFRNPDFWYYDKDVYPSSFVSPLYTWQVNLNEFIEQQNVIILMQTNNGEECDFGYGFVDRAWPDYDTSQNNRIRIIETILTRSPDNMKLYREKATALNVPVESVIRADAVFAGNNLLLKKK